MALSRLKRELAGITMGRDSQKMHGLFGPKDLFNGELVGYAMSERRASPWSSKPCSGRVSIKCLPKGLVHYSEQASKYCSGITSNCYASLAWKPP